MATEIKMPQLSDTMSAGKILVWLKKEGDEVKRGDVLAEVETDKANLQIEAFHQGTLLKILCPANNEAKVGEAIAFVGAAGENVTTSDSQSPASSVSSSVSLALTTFDSPPSLPQSSHSENKVVEHPAIQLMSMKGANAREADSASHKTSSSARVKASPLAKKIAEERNINLHGIAGSGPNGRIVRKDLDSLAAASTTNLASQTVRATTTQNVQPINIRPDSIQLSQLTPMSKMRETIARRMQESVTTSPHFYVWTTINMREAKKLREKLKEREDFKGISINHLVIKACGYALKHEPRVNRAVQNGQIFQPPQINLGIITALDDGLLIPVIRDADTLSLKDLVFEARAAVERARAGRPNSSDLLGGTFSISNLGMYDVEQFTAIINPGQGGILAVGALKEAPIVENGAVVAGLTMRVTLSVDHRIIDGVMAGIFLNHLKDALETPALLDVF
jgi:pyruvate dehydrogenase E2 component (dihydrolipoamide acetyltransferase)